MLLLMEAQTVISQAVIIAVLALVGGAAAAALINGLFTRPKNSAETKKLVAEEGNIIDQRWKAWADELEERLENERAQYQRTVGELQNRVLVMEEKLYVSEQTVKSLEDALVVERGLVGVLQRELNREKKVTRAVIGWAFALRTEVLRVGGTIPDTPVVLEDYLNEIDGPYDAEVPEQKDGKGPPGLPKQ